MPRNIISTERLRNTIEQHGMRAKRFDGNPVIEQLGELSGNTYIEALALIAAHSSKAINPQAAKLHETAK